MSVIQLLVERRRELKLTQAEVAERMGVGQPTISHFENGNSDPLLTTVQRYARAVGLSLGFTAYEPTPDECIDWVRENINADFPKGVHVTVQDDWLHEAYQKLQLKAWREGVK